MKWKNFLPLALAILIVGYVSLFYEPENPKGAYEQKMQEYELRIQKLDSAKLAERSLRIKYEARADSLAAIKTKTKKKHEGIINTPAPAPDSLTRYFSNIGSLYTDTIR